ncbi:MAG: class I tRNA ligase family protein [Patescibacteria group bacterium]|nr:class I tRNA ligase family protein [Patescibacteria group bacterium]
MAEAKNEVVRREEEILAFWTEHTIFEKSLSKPSPKGEFVFYEGPPTANGRPGIHHLESRAFKDAIPRFRTMQGYHVRRKAGWDTHGLPVELEIEKEIGSKSKKDIEAYGVAKFNQKCKESVLRYVDEWKRFSERIAFWMDHTSTYFTFDNSYIESVWNVIAQANARGLLYKDYKVVPWCPRCGTALSSHEVALGYEEVEDPSVYIKFKVKNPEKIGLKGDVYLLAWTTTPWTLPGNVVLAVKENVGYAFEGGIITHTPGGTIKGSQLAGLEYEPLYPFLADSLPTKEKEKLHNAYKVYAADFVSTGDGTGIVHTAVMYGADDFDLGTKVGLPKHHLVGEDGKFTAQAGPLAGQFFKKADTWVMGDLESRGLLYKKETVRHTYPFCWRCKTPLMYYADTSWYIRMSQLKNKLISENQTIHWEPAHIRDGRFGEWLKEVKDWAISRSRYWGTPLPVWQHGETKEIKVAGSIDDLLALVPTSGNRYFVMRHGAANSNGSNIFDTKGDPTNHLTGEGRQQAVQAAQKLKAEHIDLIVTSPVLRTKETAEVVREALGLPQSALVEDERLWEMRVGVFDGKPIVDWIRSFKDPQDQLTAAPEGGESLNDIRRRVGEFLFETEKRYSDKNILIVTHECPGRILNGVANHLSPKGTGYKDLEHPFLRHAEVKEVPFTPYPHNADFELDLHRPYIDELNTGEWKRVPDVMDVWLDSGAMPFAQDHYPFENKSWVEGKGYPADYICEAIDQTRGWFYTLHAVGNIMGRGKAFKNVICLGHVLDAKGKKMSKSIGNVVEPWSVIDKYGVDVLRYFMFTVNAPGDSKNFDERIVDEISKKNIGRLGNVLSFYKLYAKDQKRSSASDNVLDRWIVARLQELIQESTAGYEGYQLDRAVRPLGTFIDDLSAWYVRRSRDRMKEDGADKDAALGTLRHILYTLACTMAPAMPFFAEYLFQAVREGGDAESVHLAPWPAAHERKGILARLFAPQERADPLIADMRTVRELASAGLKLREKAGIKVRQPLASIAIPNTLPIELGELLMDELNVKQIKQGSEVALDTTITPELKVEGQLREWVRAIQDWRKTEGLSVSDRPGLLVESPDADFIRAHRKELMSATGLLSLEAKDGQETVFKRL